MITLRPFFENGFLNFLVRFIEKTSVINEKTISVIDNWQYPRNNSRLDNIIKKYFPYQKRSYFVEQNNIHTLAEIRRLAYNEALQEQSKGGTQQCFSFLFNFNSFINNHPEYIDILKCYYYVDIEEKQFSNGLTESQISSLENLLKSVDTSKIIGFKIPSKFNSNGHITPFFNVVILDNNPLYDLLIQNLYLEPQTYPKKDSI